MYSAHTSIWISTVSIRRRTHDQDDIIVFLLLGRVPTCPIISEKKLFFFNNKWNLSRFSSRVLSTVFKSILYRKPEAYKEQEHTQNELRLTFSGWYRVFSLTWPASMQIYWNKRKRLHKKGVQLPQDWFGKPTWPPFHCFGTPIWPPWRHVKTLYLLQ